MGQVARQTEEDLALMECFASGACAIMPACRLRGVLGEALPAFLAVLDRYSLTDLLRGGEGMATAKLLGMLMDITDGKLATRVAE